MGARRVACAIYLLAVADSMVVKCNVIVSSNTCNRDGAVCFMLVISREYSL